MCYLRIALRARSASGLLDALGLGYDLPVGQAVYAIDAFRMTICSGVSNGSAALATIRAFPAAEIIRFYYGPSTRLAQALFWGEYHNMFNADRSDVFKEERL